MKVVIDDCRLERMDVYTDPLNDKIKRQAAEITRLLKENAELKKDLEYYHTGTDICDIESARAEGQNEAWKLAHKMSRMGFDEAAECFPDYDLPLGMSSLTKKYSYSEAAAKVAAWEKTKEEICVGDVLLSNGTGNKCIVTRIGSETVTTLYGDGSCSDKPKNVIKEVYKKIGHIDVNTWLTQIGGDCND